MRRQGKRKHNQLESEEYKDIEEHKQQENKLRDYRLQKLKSPQLDPIKIIPATLLVHPHILMHHKQLLFQLLVRGGMSYIEYDGEYNNSIYGDVIIDHQSSVYLISEQSTKLDVAKLASTYLNILVIYMVAPAKFLNNAKIKEHSSSDYYTIGSFIISFAYSCSLGNNYFYDRLPGNTKIFPDTSKPPFSQYFKYKKQP